VQLKARPMRLFRRREPWAIGPSEPVPAEPAEPVVSVARTLVKSEPELAELVASDPRLGTEEITVELAEKGFGTRVSISVTASSGFEEADLERLLDELAEPQRRPFTNA
jgi:hypothetical protein